MTGINQFDNSLVIFDLDGTLLDTTNQIFSCLNAARLEFGFSQRSEAEVLKLIGRPVEELFLDLGLDSKKMTQLIFYFRELLSSKIEEGVPVYEGAIDILTSIKSHGAHISVATSKSTILAAKSIKNSNIASYIDFVQGSEMGNYKPDPWVINECIQKFESSRSIMIGDRIEDGLAAKYANIDFIAVTQTSHAGLDFKKIPNIGVFNNLREISESKIINTYFDFD